MKALVLAGGSGTRLRPFTYTMSKQLIPVANKPVLLYGLENLRDAGIDEIAIIVGDRSQEIRDAVGDGSALGIRVTYIHQEAPLGLAHCVLLAADFLGDDDFLMYLGDNVLIGGITDVAEEFRALRPDAQLLLVKVSNPREFGVCELDEQGGVRAVVEKPDHPTSDLALTGVYFFTPAIHEAVQAITPSARGELEITDAIQWLIAAGRSTRATQFTGYWKDTGRLDDVLECNRVMLERLTRRVAGSVDAASDIDGAVVIEPGAVVRRSRIAGPAVIGADARIEDTVIGPYTSIGRGCAFADAGVDYSIVLDGVSVRGVRGLHGSLIGRSADVSPALDSLHRRLVIGDDTRVEVG